MHLVKFGCFQPRHHHYPPPTNTDQAHTVHTVPWCGGLNTVHKAPKQYPQNVAPAGIGVQVRTAGWCMLSAPPARSKQPTLRIANCQAAQLFPRPGPGPNCPPNLRPWPITGGAKSYRCACHWTAAAGHHAIPAAMWTVSLVKSNHLSGKQPGQAPPWETMFRCGSFAGLAGGKIADLSFH